jgi:methionyl-tRNA formyltransferase
MAAADGWLYLEDLQQEGKKRMPVAEFLRGFRL